MTRRSPWRGSPSGCRSSSTLHPEFETAGRAVRHLAGPARRPRGLTGCVRLLGIPPRPGGCRGQLGCRFRCAARRACRASRRAVRRGVRVLRARQRPGLLGAAGRSPRRAAPGRDHSTSGWTHRSMAGGRELWAIPKGLATSRWRPATRCADRVGPGEPIAARFTDVSRRWTVAVPGRRPSRGSTAATEDGALRGSGEDAAVPRHWEFAADGPGLAGRGRPVASFRMADFRLSFGRVPVSAEPRAESISKTPVAATTARRRP